MIDMMNLVDADRDRATAGDRPRPHRSPGWRRWTDALLHRWPTALGIGVAALAANDMQGGLEFAGLAVLLAVVYLGAAVLDRRWSAWAVLLAGLPLALFLPSISGIHPVAVLLVVAGGFLVVGVARGQLVRPGGLPLQTAGMLAFGSTVLLALYAGPGLGGKLVGVAILTHAAWDAYHYLRNTVVPRSYAEFCVLVDLLLGAAIIFMT
jgi:hypothetical protein